MTIYIFNYHKQVVYFQNSNGRDC